MFISLKPQTQATSDLIGFTQNRLGNSVDWANEIQGRNGLVTSVDFNDHPLNASMQNDRYADLGVTFSTVFPLYVALGPVNGSTSDQTTNFDYSPGEGVHDDSARIRLQITRDHTVTISFDEPQLGVGITFIDLNNRPT